MMTIYRDSIDNNISKDNEVALRIAALTAASRLYAETSLNSGYNYKVLDHANEFYKWLTK